MRLLDLFCGAGGAAMGYSRAGFTEIVGVDIKPQPRYPFAFVLGDALHYLRDHGAGFDVIHASPPCQRYSSATPTSRRSAHSDLVAPLRELLVETGVPFVIENVPSAPLRRDVMLCGVMFGLPIARHRVFETTAHMIQPAHPAHPDDIVQVTGGGPCNLPARPGVGGPRRKPNADEARRIMGMPWATKRELNEAIPPAYSEWLGRRVLDSLAA